MLKINGTFLESKVARRMFTLFVVSALLPIAILAFFSIRQINTLTIHNIEHELRQSTKNYGLAVYDRLILLNEKLILNFIDQTANNQRIIASTDIAGFTQFHTFNFNDDNYLPANNLPPLSIKQRRFLQQGEPVLMTHFQENLPTKLYLFHAIKSTGLVSMGLIDNELLWGKADTFDDSKGFCIYGSENKLLFCSQPQLDGQLQLIKSDWQQATTGNLKWREDEKTFLVGYWSLFLEPRFLYPNFTIVISSDQKDAFAPASDLKTIFIMVSLLTLIIIAFMSTIQIRRYLVPLEELMRGIQRISNNNFKQPVTVKTDDEFHHLANSFNSMSTQLSQQFEFLTTMAEIDQLILANITIKEIVSTIITQGNKAVQSETIDVALANELDNDLFDIYSEDIHHVHGVSTSPQAIDKAHRHNLSHKKTAFYPISDQKLPPYLNPLIKESLQSFVLVPVVIHEKLTAILIFGFKHIEFSQDMHFRLREIGDRFTIALEKSAWDEKLYLQAHYDPLTQLPNRLLLNERLQQAIKHSTRNNSHFSLMFIDLDRFKTVNDSLGHASGDQLLKIVSQRLTSTLRDGDTVARLGGDEFIIFLSEYSSASELYSNSSLIARKLLTSIAKSYFIDNQEVHISASIGIASFPNDGQNLESLVKNADSAMYHAKEEGRNNFKFYSKDLNEKALQQLVIETNLHHALQNNEFELYYQPKVAAQSNKIIGAEALIRWTHPIQGVMYPQDFIPVAEECGLIKEIGEWSLREACRQNKKWQRKGLVPIPISVNISSKQFQQPELIELVSKAFNDIDLDPAYLDLEIVESAAMHNLEQTINTLKQLNQLGVSISIDDYGTGFSTLSYLKQFPVDILKIDRMFIQNLVHDSGDQAIVSSTILLAHNLCLSVVAEGVENKEQLAILKNLGCDVIQGYYFSKPVEADCFEKLLSKGIINPED